MLSRPDALTSVQRLHSCAAFAASCNAPAPLYHSSAQMRHSTAPGAELVEKLSLVVRVSYGDVVLATVHADGDGRNQALGAGDAEPNTVATSAGMEHIKCAL